MRLIGKIESQEPKTTVYRVWRIEVPDTDHFIDEDGSLDGDALREEFNLPEQAGFIGADDGEFWFSDSEFVCDSLNSCF